MKNIVNKYQLFFLIFYLYILKQNIKKMRNFIILILYVTTLSFLNSAQLDFIPIEKYGKKEIKDFSKTISFSLDISDIKKGENIYLTYTSPNLMADLYFSYSWTKDNYKNVNKKNIITADTAKFSGTSETNIAGKKTFSYYYYLEKIDSSYNTLVIDLSKGNSLPYFEYLQIEHKKNNPINAILIFFVVIFLIIFVVSIISCCYKYCCRNDMENQYSYQNDMAIPMYNQYNYPPNNQYNNQLYNQYNK